MEVSHEIFASKYKNTEIETLIDYSDPNYERYIPKRTRLIPFKCLVKTEPFQHLLFGMCTAIYLPDYVTEFTIFNSHHEIYLRVYTDTCTSYVPIETILAQTRELPCETNTCLKGYIRYTPLEPFIPRGSKLLIPETADAYIELLIDSNSIYDMYCAYYSIYTKIYYRYTNYINTLQLRCECCKEYYFNTYPLEKNMYHSNYNDIIDIIDNNTSIPTSDKF